MATIQSERTKARARRRPPRRQRPPRGVTVKAAGALSELWDVSPRAPEYRTLLQLVRDARRAGQQVLLLEDSGAIIIASGDRCRTVRHPVLEGPEFEGPVGPG